MPKAPDIHGNSKYNPEYHPEKAFQLSLLKATQREIAQIFDISEQTLTEWKRQHLDFLEAIKKGSDQADAKVAKSLYHRANGYSHPEDKIFMHEGKPVIVKTVKHYPPDTAAAFIWLKNRQPDKWRDKQDININMNSELLESLISALPEGEARIAFVAALSAGGQGKIEDK